MKHNDLPVTTGTRKQLWYKAYLLFMLLMCGAHILSALYIWWYKGNERALFFSPLALILIVVILYNWPKKPVVYKGRIGVDYASSAQKLLRTMASQDRPE
jgi:hypothetical protein